MRPFLTIALLTATAWGQISTPENPVYVDDSPIARDVLLSLGDLERQGSMAEAVRSLQSLLEEQAAQLLPTEMDSDVFGPVRSAVHERIMSDPPLLEAYRAAQEPEAERLLSSGNESDVVRSRFLTSAGFEAGLRVAQLQMEHARFEASLLTLRELETHPDFSTRRPEAIAVLTQLARYIDRQDVRELLTRWGGPQADEAVQPPPGVDLDVIGPMGAGPETELAGIIPRPLASELLSPAEAPPSDKVGDAGFASMRVLPDESVFAWALPSVVNDIIYTNDGDNITAWDRFTLRQLWRVRRTDPTSDNIYAQRDIRRRQSRRIEDSSEVTVAGNRVLAVTGLPVGGTRQGDGRLHCIDRTTGAVQWSVDPVALDPQLADGSIRGPAAVVEGTVVIAVRKSARERRTVSVYLVGLDLQDGSLRWVRLIGSAGALPFQTSARFPERIAVRRGVVYRADEIGVVAAVEAATGRPRWVRRFDAFHLYDNDVRPPWSSSGPIVDGDRIITISPARDRVLALDADTGKLVGSVDSARLASPLYLLRAGPELVAVGQHQLAWTDLSAFPDGRIDASGQMVSPPIVGRIAVAGRALVIPRNGMMTTLDLPTRQERTIAIDQPGNFLALDGQLLATDDIELHSYMVWDVASKLLQRRLEEDPSNPAPAATLAELAFRAGRFDQIVQPLDRALQAIRGAPRAHEQIRRGLYVAVLNMIEPALGPQPAEDDKPAALAITDVDLLAALTDRLEALAETPEELVAHRLVQASLRDSLAKPAAAIESLQSILADEFMASAFWHGGQLTIRADLEATRRARAILEKHGWSAYADFQREAQVHLQLLGSGAAAGEYESLANQYPFSTLAPQFWLSAAQLGSDDLSVRRLQAGVRSLETLRDVRAPIDASVAGELFGRAVHELIGEDRINEAHIVVATLVKDFPDVQTTVDGAPVAVDELLASAADTAAPQPRAVIGTTIVADASPPLEQGRVLVPALKHAHQSPRSVLLASPSSRRLRLMELDASGALQERWSIEASFEPILLAMGPSDALIAWLEPEGMQLEDIELSTHESRWKIKPLTTAAALENGQQAPLINGFITPLEGRVLSDQVVVAADERMIAVAERSGRLVTIDRRSGRKLWSGATPVERVFDMALGSGMVVVAGTAPDASEQWKTKIVTLDARTGRVASQLDDTPGTVRWVRLTDDRLMIAGVDGGLVCVDLDQAQVRWMLQDDATIASLDAWVFDDQLYVLDQNRSLWRVDIPSGRLEQPELETRGRLLDRIGIRAEHADGHVLFASGSGLLIYGRDGTLVGIDVFDTAGAMVASEAGRDVIAMMDTSPIQSPDGLSSYVLHLLSTSSGRLLSSVPIRTQATPESVTLLDGKVLISAGEATMVLDAPATP